jgi:hypothetical protein
MDCAYVFGDEDGDHVEVRTADALTIPADAAVFGKCPPVRAALEAATGARFEPWRCGPGDLLPKDLLQSSRGPWRRAVSLAYHPRRRPLPERPRPAACSHAGRLIVELNALFGRLERLGATTILILPLSWRNPDVVIPATVAALWWHCWARATFGRVPDGARRARRPPPAHTFILADRDDASIYIPALENRDDRLRDALVKTLISSDRLFRRGAFRRRD